MRPPSQKSLPYMHLGEYQDEREETGLLCAEASMTEEEEASNSSFTDLTSDIPREMSAFETPYFPQSPQRASSPPAIVACIPMGPSDEASDNQGRGTGDFVQWVQPGLRAKVSKLVRFLLLKYQMKELTSKAEILERIISEYEMYYPMIFQEATESVKLVFGIDVVEIDPFVHYYVLVPALGITYDGMRDDIHCMPKTGLLIIILGVIFMEGNCVREDIIWRILNNIEVCAGREHFIYGEPIKLIAEDFVQQGYLEYRQVDASDPACFEFLWGPRAHTEITKMKVLEFFASVTRTDPRSYPMWYAEALKDEEVRAQARTAQLMLPML